LGAKVLISKQNAKEIDLFLFIFEKSLLFIKIIITFARKNQQK